MAKEKQPRKVVSVVAITYDIYDSSELKSAAVKIFAMVLRVTLTLLPV